MHFVMAIVLVRQYKEQENKTPSRVLVWCLKEKEKEEAG